MGIPPELNGRRGGIAACVEGPPGWGAPVWGAIRVGGPPRWSPGWGGHQGGRAVRMGRPTGWEGHQDGWATGIGGQLVGTGNREGLVTGMGRPPVWAN